MVVQIFSIKIIYEGEIMKFKILVLKILLIFLILPVDLSMSKDKSSNDGNFKIIFWGSNVSDMDMLENYSYSQLISKYDPLQILSDKHIVKYYWDEQLIEYDYNKLKEDSGNYFILTLGLFSIVLKNDIIYHGINRTNMTAVKWKYDDSNYPALIGEGCVHPGSQILVLKPRYLPASFYFKDYDKAEREAILNNDVLKYFEDKGKIIRGKIDLKKLFGRKQISRIR